MTQAAIWMAVFGFALLYGGLAFCVGVAWYHGKQAKAGGAEAETPTGD